MMTMPKKKRITGLRKRAGVWHMDVTVQGVRYRESLNTADWQEACSLKNQRIAEIKAGKGASKRGRAFARKPFSEAADIFQEERKPHVAPRTMQFEKERLKPLKKFFGGKSLLRIKAEDIAAYQQSRLKDVAGRTINMEVATLRKMLKKAKLWSAIQEDVTMFPEDTEPVAKVLTPEQKRLLFDTAASKDAWLVAHCAAVIAVSTSCRSVELKHLRWQHVDLFAGLIDIKRSKTKAGHRRIPLVADAMAAFARLRERAEAFGSTDSEHFVFPTCENGHIDPTKPQVTWRSAWRSLVKATARRAGDRASEEALGRHGDATEARREAEAPFMGFRFHDLRHQCITELVEAGEPDATIMAVAGHVSEEMLEHYSHVRMDAKRKALERLDGGLMQEPKVEEQPLSQAVN